MIAGIQKKTETAQLVQKPEKSESWILLDLKTYTLVFRQYLQVRLISFRFSLYLSTKIHNEKRSQIMITALGCFELFSWSQYGLKFIAAVRSAAWRMIVVWILLIAAQTEASAERHCTGSTFELCHLTWTHWALLSGPVRWDESPIHLLHRARASKEDGKERKMSV